jgi:hypothetical protein
MFTGIKYLIVISLTNFEFVWNPRILYFLELPTLQPFRFATMLKKENSRVF